MAPLALISFEAVISPTNVNPLAALPVIILSVVIAKLALILGVDIPPEDVICVKFKLKFDKFVKLYKV